VLQALREEDTSVLKDEVNQSLFNDKKFCRECVKVCATEVQKFEMVEELIDFLHGASEETRNHIDVTIKEALTCAVKSQNEQLCIGKIVKQRWLRG
jgi:hypothetical protein